MSEIPIRILEIFLLPSDSLVEFRAKKLKHIKGKMLFVPIPETLKLLFRYLTEIGFTFYEIRKSYDSLGTYYFD